MGWADLGFSGTVRCPSCSTVHGRRLLWCTCITDCLLGGQREQRQETCRRSIKRHMCFRGIELFGDRFDHCICSVFKLGSAPDRTRPSFVGGTDAADISVVILCVSLIHSIASWAVSCKNTSPTCRACNKTTNKANKTKYLDPCVNACFLWWA